MGSPPEFRVDEAALGWDPAEVTVPAVPAVAAGGDPLSLMISSVMPDVATDVTQQVAATRAREEQFAANLSAARNRYQGTDGAGEQQINAAAGGLADPASKAAGSGAASAATGSPAGDSGLGQFGQLMGMAMQLGQQAVQAPMQAVGMAGQIPQAVMQGVQGLAQQAGQSSEKSGPGTEGAGGENGANGLDRAAEQQREAGSEKPEDKRDDEKSEEEKKDDKPTAQTGSEGGQRAPVGGPQPESSTPGGAPGHRRMTEIDPEIAL